MDGSEDAREEAIALARERNVALAECHALRAALAEQQALLARREAATEEALHDGEARWRGVFEQMHEGFALCEMVRGVEGTATDFRYVQVNAAWERLTGVPAAATVGRLASEVFPGIEDFWGRTYARVVETEEPARFEHWLGPVRRWFDVLVYRTAPGHFAALFLNVTERRAAEARRDALVELGDRLRDLRDPAEIARVAAEVIGRALGATRAGYGVVDASEDTIRVERDWSIDPLGSLAGTHYPMSAYWAGYLNDLRRGEAVVMDDVAKDPRSADRAKAHFPIQVRAQLLIPVVEAGRITALLYIHASAPRHWSVDEVAFARGAAERAWAAAHRARADMNQALLLAELNHRVKNTLFIVQSIATQTARGATDLPSFSAAFQARLIALARAHDLLSDRNWEGAGLAAVIRAAFDPMAEHATRVDLSGVALGAILPPTTALAFTMVLHELAANARRHGALSVPEERVSVACRATASKDGSLVINWVERGGPLVAGSPARRGFGLRLLASGLTAEAGVRGDIRFEPKGVRCSLRLPSSHLVGPDRRAEGA